MSKFRKKKKSVPAVNTAALPDIVFMLLFFFMVSTTARETSMQVDYTLPSATEVKKLEDKSLVTTIYVGKAKDSKYGTGYNQIQLNDKIATPDDVPRFILRAREDVAEDHIRFMTTSIKADVKASMGVITDIRLKLRDVNALKLSYSTTKGADNN